MTPEAVETAPNAETPREKALRLMEACGYADAAAAAAAYAAAAAADAADAAADDAAADDAAALVWMDENCLVARRSGRNRWKREHQ